jgi:predicted AlkP superfamily phosphohydrolase/phosphomutase
MGLPQKGKKRVCIIGLDGVPFDLLLKFTSSDVMPGTRKLAEKGHLHKMKASLPEVSSVSWTSFMTGTNPGNHGIFGFTDFREHSYQIRFPNFLDVKAPTIFDQLGDRGLKSIVINQPSTYPARKIEGALVSGFVSIDLAKAVYPTSNLAALQEMDYQIDIDTLKARHDREFLWKELDSTLKARLRAFQYFWQQEWDLFELVVTGTDRLHHYLWNAYGNPEHPEHGGFIKYYQKIDNLIVRVASEFEKLTGGIQGLYLLSDHGFTGIVQEIHLNKWLDHANYLKFDTPSPQRLADIAPGTRAFALDPNRIYLNLKGKFPRGTVEKSDKKLLKKELAGALRELEYQGKKVVREVFDTEEIYSGPCVAKAPDLIVLANHGFDMKGSLGKQEIFGLSDLQGMHTWDDACFWTSNERKKDLVISDVKAMIMEEFE